MGFNEAFLHETLPDGCSGYSIVVDGLPMVVTLGHDDVDYDEQTSVKLRQLNLTVYWDYGKTNLTELQGPSLTLSTYIRVDA